MPTPQPLQSLAPANHWSVAGREALSLALIETRNSSLTLFTRFESAGRDADEFVLSDGRRATALWLLGRVGWFAERWTNRNTQRALGVACPAQPVRLASIEPSADLWWGDSGGGLARQRPDAALVRQYLLEALEGTLAILEKTPETAEGLYLFRMALFHEALQAEVFAEAAQTLGVDLGLERAAGAAAREPLVCPATRWRLGHEGPGWHSDVDSGSQELALPEFEIDAGPVTWAQFSEFVADGGYDRRELWRPDGWLWLSAQQGARRGPRHVEQMGSGAVTVRRFGKTVRVATGQAVAHATWWEADAFARWAGRRLPHEAEWDCAARTAGRRGFAWGQVWEWTSGTLAPLEGKRTAPWSACADAGYGRCRVLKGASFATAPRLVSASSRGFALPSRDEGFTGFRTCAL